MKPVACSETLKITLYVKSHNFVKCIITGTLFTLQVSKHFAVFQAMVKCIALNKVSLTQSILQKKKNACNLCSIYYLNLPALPSKSLETSNFLPLKKMVGDKSLALQQHILNYLSLPQSPLHKSECQLKRKKSPA